MTRTWQSQSEPVSRSLLPLWAPPKLLLPWPGLLFWTQAWLEPLWNRSWLITPAVRHPHYSSLSLWFVGWPLHTWGMGWQNPLSLLIPTAYSLPIGWICRVRSTKLGIYAQDLGTWVNQCSCSLPINNHLGLINASHQVCDGVWIKEKDWGSFLLSCPLGCSHTGWSWSGVREGMQGAYCWLLWLSPVGGWTAFPWFPQTNLKLWLEWDIPVPYGPSPGI